jgi:hypothetical protein
VRFAALLALLVGCQAATGRVEVPEPMVFDLVRGLGAHKGELEANVLAVLPLESGDPTAPAAAPEVEYAVIDDLAFELELPIEDGGLFSVKAAGQYTLGAAPQKGYIHGTQVIVERLVEADAWDLTALYIPAFRFDRHWSALFMLGLGGLVGPDVEDDVGTIANGTLFYRVNRTWTIGFELDSVLFANAGSSMLFMPQAHWHASELFTLQLGVGVLYIDGNIAAGTELLVPAATGWYPQFAFRAIFEF